MLSIKDRSKHLVSTHIYGEDIDPTPVWYGDNISIPVCPYREQYILRMQVKRPGSSLRLPRQLKWLERACWDAILIQKEELVDHPFMYLTVRSGIVKSQTDDVWHVDGFSLKTPHLPEQQFLYSDCFPTQCLSHRIPIPEDFDGMKHNIHTFFQERADESRICAYPGWIGLDPYVIHRRNPESSGKRRTMVRISFVPIEIQDDTNTFNPLLPTPRYNNVDIREKLVRYE